MAVKRLYHNHYTKHRGKCGPCLSYKGPILVCPDWRQHSDCLATSELAYDEGLFDDALERSAGETDSRNHGPVPKGVYGH